MPTTTVWRLENAWGDGPYIKGSEYLSWLRGNGLQESFPDGITSNDYDVETHPIPQHDGLSYSHLVTGWVCGTADEAAFFAWFDYSDVLFDLLLEFNYLVIEFEIETCWVEYGGRQVLFDKTQALDYTNKTEYVLNKLRRENQDGR